MEEISASIEADILQDSIASLEDLEPKWSELIDSKVHLMLAWESF